MELYLNKLFTMLKQQIHNKQKKNLNLFLQKTNYSISNLQKYNNNTNANNKKSNSKEEKYNFYQNEKEYFHGIILNKFNISTIRHSPLTPFIKECFNNLEYLSLNNNHIRNLHFIKYLPNLYYLDMSDNPLEDIETLNIKNVFGYLKLSLERYSEKKILNVNGLYCGILELYLNDESLLTLFKNNNPFICLFNNRINYFYDKVISDEEKDSKRTRRYSFKAFKSLFERNINIENNNDEEGDSNKEESKESNKKEKYKFKNKDNNKNDISDFKLGRNMEKKNSNNSTQRKMKRTNSIKLKYTFINCYNYGFKSKKGIKIIDLKKKGIENEIKNEGLLKIKHFYDEYNDAIINICNNCNTRGRQSKIPIRSKYLKNYKDYLSIEKKKLILINSIYNKLSIFNKEKKENKYFINNKEYLNANPNVDYIEIFKLKNYIKCIYTDPNIAIIVLIGLLFYSLGIISNLMMRSLIGHLLIKYYNFPELLILPKFENENSCFHFLAYYFDNYENIKNKFNYSDIKDNKILDIMNILEMNKIVLKSNELYFNKKNNNFNLYNIEKNKYYAEINYLESLGIKDEVLMLLTYLCDFIVYENIEQLLINGGYPYEYSHLIRFKEIIKEKEYKLRENELALSERKYQKHQIERLYNKFYFKLYKIEEIQNSTFNNKKKKNIKFIKTQDEKIEKNNDNFINTDEIEDINKYFIIQNKGLNLNNNKKLFKNDKIINSIKSISPIINNYNFLKYKNNLVKLKINNNYKINISTLTSKIYSDFSQENKKSKIRPDKLIKYRDKNKLILKTLTNFKLKNKFKTFDNIKLLLKNKNSNNKFTLSDSMMFKTFSNKRPIKSIYASNLYENDINIKEYNSYKNKEKNKFINEIEDLFDEQNKKITIRNNDKYNSLKNAERIYSKKRKDFLFLMNKNINMTEKGIINNSHYNKSRNKNINYKNIPSLDIQKYNQKEMARILLNYKNKKNINFIKKESKNV